MRTARRRKGGERPQRGAISKPGGAATANIKSALPSLLPAERKVADYVLANSEDVLAQSVGEVAAGAGVSEATVVRFCRTVGFLGFADLKIGLARELVTPIASALHEDISEKDDPATLTKKVFGANIDTLRDTLHVLDPAEMDRAARIINKAGKTLVIGVGTSSPIAMDAYVKLMRLGLPVSVQTDAHLMMMEAALLSKGDAVVVISHSGQTKDPVEAVAVAKKAGASAVAITNNSLSPLAKSCDVTLVTSSKETKFRAEALSSRIAQASIVDLLYISIGLKNRRRALASAKKIEDVITAKQY